MAWRRCCASGSICTRPFADPAAAARDGASRPLPRRRRQGNRGPHRQLAWSEYTRNTLAAHAHAFPDHRGGTISVDDACNSYYAKHPARCGDAIPSSYDGQITEQPTWMVMGAINFAGITPTQAGYTIAPHFPFAHFSLRLPEIGIASESHRLRGYIITQRTTSLLLDVRIPAGVSARSIVTWADGRRVHHRTGRATASFACSPVPVGPCRGR